MDIVRFEDIVLFSGRAHPKLAREIAELLGVTLGHVDLGLFPDGEISVQILDNVRGRDAFVVQPVALDPNFYLMELLIMLDALRRASAKSVTAVIPYYGYCRQDRKDKPRVPITAKLMANMLADAGATRVLTMDLHANQVEGFFDIPVDNLHGRPQLLEAVKVLGLKDYVVVTPDIGSVKIARAFANEAGADFAIVDKHRKSATEVEVFTVIGDVKGKDVLLADDMCSTGGTLVSAAKACQEKGANRIYAAVTHGLFVGDAVKAIEASPIVKVLATNTIPATDRLAKFSKLTEVSVAVSFAQAIKCMLRAESISSMYEH